MARLTKNCSYGHRDLLSSFPKRPYFLSSGEWTLRNNFSRASWFIRVLSAHSRTRVWGRDLPVTPVILRNKGFPCITSTIIPSPSSHCLLGRCRLPDHEIEPARVSPGFLLIHPVVIFLQIDKTGEPGAREASCGAAFRVLPRACVHPPLREGHRPRAQRDALTLTVWAPGRVTLTLANAADHENEQSGGRCGPHHWILWTMIVVGVARPPHSISGTTYRAPRL